MFGWSRKSSCGVGQWDWCSQKVLALGSPLMAGGSPNCSGGGSCSQIKPFRGQGVPSWVKFLAVSNSGQHVKVCNVEPSMSPQYVQFGGWESSISCKVVSDQRPRFRSVVSQVLFVVVCLARAFLSVGMSRLCKLLSCFRCLASCAIETSVVSRLVVVLRSCHGAVRMWRVASWCVWRVKFWSIAHPCLVAWSSKIPIGPLVKACVKCQLC